MANWRQLQSKLEELLENDHVYYQPPESVKIEYPGIIYSKSNIKVTHANDAKYSMKTRYEIIVIGREPDHPVIQKLLELPYCSYDRNYTTNNLYHDVLTLYY